MSEPKDTGDVKRKEGRELGAISERLISHGRELGEIKIDVQRLEAAMENVKRDHDTSMKLAMEKIGKFEVAQASTNAKLDQLLEFRSDVRSGTSWAAGKAFSVVVAVLVFAALAVIVAIELLRR